MNESSPSASADSFPQLLPQLSNGRAWLIALVLAAAYFAGIAPTLTWPEFNSGNEDIVVQTALEMRHSGPVFSKSSLVPTMLGEPRVKKPPLVAWITAAAMRPETVAQLDIPATRQAAYRALAWQVRWTGLLAASVMLLATFELGRLIGGGATGLIAAIAVGTNFIFMKYMRQSTSDVHLAMWVTIANAALMHGLIRKRWWIAATLGAIAVAMAFLCKGPVALLETVLPLAILVPLHVRGAAAGESPDANAAKGRAIRLLQLACGVVLFCLVGLPWFVHVYRTVPNVWHTWFTEVSRNGATVLDPDSPLTYFQLVPDLWPWIIFGFFGLVAIKSDRRLWIPLLQVLVPLLIMVCVKDRKERYLLPMIGPAAVLCGAGGAAWLRSIASVAAWPKWVRTIHVVVLLVGVAIFLILGSSGTQLQTGDHKPWFEPKLAGWSAVAFASLTGLWVIAQRRKAWAIFPYTMIVMGMLQTLFIFGYSKTAHSRTPFKAMADQIRALGPTMPVHDWLGDDRRVDEGLAIYLDRTITQLEPEKVTGPAVMVMRESDTRPRPTLPPPWRVLATTGEKKTTWWAFVRE